MLVSRAKVTNCPTLNHLVCRIIQWILFSLMSGDLLLLLLVVITIMWVLLMITPSMFGYICCATNLMFSVFPWLPKFCWRTIWSQDSCSTNRSGGEYQALHPFFRRIGIYHHVSCPHTHQQNGSAEREHRHIVEMGLNLLAHSSMPLKFLGWSFYHNSFFINCLPSKVIADQTPFERLFGTQPNYTFLRTFGCAVWPNLRPYNTKKLQYWSKQCVFLGYSTMHKGFKCLDPKEGWVYISWDVVFDE